MISLSTTFNSARVTARVTQILKQNQAALDIQVIKDSNHFIPFQNGILKDSAILHSKVGEGEIKWQTPYARAQYYGLPNKSKDQNTNARMKWFEEAKAVYLHEWEEVASGGFR